ncbi:uncharacterized protein LOC130975258 [Arachis stenosperma]|uniref:uncharacterized protein LOC130975258 n=1 Tax=Arachis stenosperma TaxID=217475 RepID=UPI0025ABE6C2|nr:uncharacterized protein LOC130975258 [Arachis stenosperma]
MEPVIDSSRYFVLRIEENTGEPVMAPRVKGHRGSHTTAAAAISTTSTSFGTSVVPDFQSGPLSQQPYLMVPNPGYTGLPPPSWPSPRCMGLPPPPPPPISIPPSLCNFSLLVDSETPGSSSTSPPSKTASVPNSVTKERLVPDGKTRYWETNEKWKNIRKKARENRASLLGGSVHCGGSIQLSSTIKRMKKQLGRTPTHEEVRASSSSSAVPLPPPPSPPSISSDEDYDDDEDEDDTEYYS